MLYFILDNLIYSINIGSAFYGNYEDLDQFPNLFRIAEIITFLSHLAIVLPFERIINRAKYVFSTINIIIVVLLIFLPHDLVEILGDVYWSLNSLLIILLLIILTKWSRKEFMAVPVTLVFGFFIMNFSIVFYGLKPLNIFPLELEYILIIISCIIYISPTVIDPQLFSRPLTYWYILAIFTIISLLGFTILISISPLPFHFLILILIDDICIFYFLYYIIKYIKSETLKESNGIPLAQTQQVKDIMAVFTRPQKITEEEVSLYRDKAICLVCKKNVYGFNFICQKCKGLYCENCARTLSDLENACWVCNTPFDESKPFKPYEKEKEEIDVGVSDKPQKRPRRDKP